MFIDMRNAIFAASFNLEDWLKAVDDLKDFPKVWVPHKLQIANLVTARF